jgi:DNA recombination protein RmuC
LKTDAPMDFLTLLIIVGIALILALLFWLNWPKQAGISTEKMVSRDAFEALHGQLNALKFDLAERETQFRETTAQLATREETIRHLEDRLLDQKAELKNVHERLKTDFENLANRLLEEKSQRFSEQNSQQLTGLLGPLRERIKDFEEKMAHQFLEETRERVSLKKELESLRDLNGRLSLEANNLASALKGQSKVQGDWGEFQLELLLEKAGLAKGLHFTTQTSLFDENGRQKRPDVIIQLPGNRHLIIDSKVSLTAFERWANEADESRKPTHLKAHIDSLRAHISGLSGKNYQSLYQINSPDYLLLFVPLDSALNLAILQEPRLFTDAMDKNIVLVTNSSLLATMRTVGHLWKQDKQTRSVQEIARQSGQLYDKFVSFVDDLRAVGNRMDLARQSFDQAMNKLTDSKVHGTTLIGQAEKIRELGAKNTKLLDKNMIELAAESNALELFESEIDC